MAVVQKFNARVKWAAKYFCLYRTRVLEQSETWASIGSGIRLSAPEGDVGTGQGKAGRRRTGDPGHRRAASGLGPLDFRGAVNRIDDASIHACAGIRHHIVVAGDAVVGRVPQKQLGGHYSVDSSRTCT